MGTSSVPMANGTNNVAIFLPQRECDFVEEATD